MTTRACERATTRRSSTWSIAFVDAIEIARAAEQGVETLSRDRQRALVALFEGDFLDGLEIDRSSLFTGWLTAQRRRFRACQAALLEHNCALASAHSNPPLAPARAICATATTARPA
jgi:hypothetical protein